MCWSNRDEITLKPKNDEETPEEITKTPNKTDYFEMENKIKEKLKECEGEKGESLIKMIMISPIRNGKIEHFDLIYLLSLLFKQLKEFFTPFPFYFLENEDNNNSLFNTYNKTNMRILIYDELNFIKILKKEINNGKSIQKSILVLPFILTIIFYSPMNNKTKSEILYQLFNPNSEGFIKSENDSVEEVFIHLIYITLYLPDIYYNFFFLNPQDEKGNIHINQINDNVISYKKKLIFLEYSKNCKKDLAKLYINSFLFSENTKKNSINKDEFMILLEKNNYNIFDINEYKNIFFKFLLKRKKAINFLNFFPSTIQEIEKKLNNYHSNTNNKKKIIHNICTKGKNKGKIDEFTSLFEDSSDIFDSLFMSNAYKEKQQIYPVKKKPKKNDKLFQYRELDINLRESNQFHRITKKKSDENNDKYKNDNFDFDFNFKNKEKELSDKESEEDKDNHNNKNNYNNNNNYHGLLDGINDVIEPKNKDDEEKKNEFDLKNNNEDSNLENNEKESQDNNIINNINDNESEDNNIRNNINDNESEDKNIRNQKSHLNNSQNSDNEKKENYNFNLEEINKNKINEKIHPDIKYNKSLQNNINKENDNENDIKLKIKNKSLNLNANPIIKMEENKTIVNDRNINENEKNEENYNINNIDNENPVTFKTIKSKSTNQKEDLVKIISSIENEDSPRKKIPPSKSNKKNKEISPSKNIFKIKEFKEDNDEPKTPNKLLKKNKKKNNNSNNDIENEIENTHKSKSNEKSNKNKKSIIGIENELIDSSKPKLSIIKVFTLNEGNKERLTYNQISNNSNISPERKTLQLNTNTIIKSGEKSDHITDDEIFKLSQSRNKFDLKQKKVKQLEGIGIKDIPKKEDGDYLENEEEKNLKDMTIQLNELNNYDKIKSPSSNNNINYQYFKKGSKVSSNTLFTDKHLSGTPIITSNQVFKKKNDNLTNPNLFDLINSYKNDLNFIDINNITIYLVYYFSHFEEYSQMDVNNVIKDLMNISPNIIKNISFKRFTPYFSSYNKESIINILNYFWNGDIINLYFNIMTLYNIFLRNSELINMKAVFIGTHFFNKLQECYFSDIYDNLLHLYKEDLFIDDTFIFDIKDYIIAIPIYTYKNIESPNEENKLFLAVFNCNTKKIIYLDSNDILSENAEVMNNYTLIFKKFFKYLFDRKLCKENISEWNFSADSIESICYDENMSNQIMTYYSKLICLYGKISTVDDKDFDKIREELFKEIAMFYIIIGKFSQEEIENEKENLLN